MFVCMIIGVMIVVGIMYIFGVVVVGLVVLMDVLKGNFLNGIFDIFKILGMYFYIFVVMMVCLVGIILFVGSFGFLVLWMVVLVKVFFLEIFDGVFGKWLVKMNEEGNLINVLLV